MNRKIELAKTALKAVMNDEVNAKVDAMEAAGEGVWLHSPQDGDDGRIAGFYTSDEALEDLVVFYGGEDIEVDDDLQI